MATADPCKKCQRKCKSPKVSNPIGVIPPIFLDLTSLPISVDTKPFLDYIRQGMESGDYCAGKNGNDVAGHCIDKAITELLNELANFVTNALQKGSLPPGQCYNIYFDGGVEIKLDCICNEKDISDGKGPPDARAKVTLSGPQVHNVNCGQST